MTNEEVLTIFLKHSRDFTSFKRQAIKCRILGASNNVRDAFDSNFIWSGTSEKHVYWSDMNKKWLKLCDDMKLRGTIDLNRL